MKVSVIRLGDTYIMKLKSGKIVIFDKEYGFTYDPQDPECHIYMASVLEAVANGEVPQQVTVEVKVRPLKESYLVSIDRERRAVVKDLGELPVVEP